MNHLNSTILVKTNNKYKRKMNISKLRYFLLKTNKNNAFIATFFLLFDIVIIILLKTFIEQVPLPLGATPTRIYLRTSIPFSFDIGQLFDIVIVALLETLNQYFSLWECLFHFKRIKERCFSSINVKTAP